MGQSPLSWQSISAASTRYTAVRSSWCNIQSAGGKFSHTFRKVFEEGALGKVIFRFAESHTYYGIEIENGPLDESLVLFVGVRDNPTCIGL